MGAIGIVEIIIALTVGLSLFFPRFGLERIIESFS
jgi:hypothetical protein